MAPADPPVQELLATYRDAIVELAKRLGPSVSPEYVSEPNGIHYDALWILRFLLSHKGDLTGD